jgi:MFS family permease
MTDPAEAVTPAASRPRAASAWTPLRVAAFRSLWLALLASNIGTWMQVVGAQWLLVDEPNASTLVAIVQTALMLPALLLALPAGALADSFDRRHLLIGTQVYLLVVGVILTVLTAAGQMPPSLLLTLTFALGVGQALTLPAWQALIPELVPRNDLPAASALGGISVNLARAIGPAVAGLLIAQVGAAAVFGFNAASYLLFALVLAMWRPDVERRDTHDSRERFTSALRAGDRYVRHSLVVRRILLRASLFIVPGTALWALLPLVASQRLGMGSSGYGLLLAALGVGAIGGAMLLPVVRGRWSGNQLLMVASGVYGLSMATVSLVRNPVVVTLALLPAGAMWTAVLSSINAAVQMFLPAWVRARGLSIFQIVFAGGQAVGAVVWGVLADAAGLVVAHLAAAALIIASGLTVRIWPLLDTQGISREPAVYWQEPRLAVEPDEREGPILVTARYTVQPDNEPKFLDAMQAVRRSRLRTGATRWGLYREGEKPDSFVEVYLVPTWDVHLRQHYGRLTGADQAAEEHAHSLADGAPEVTHLFPATPD